MSAVMARAGRGYLRVMSGWDKYRAVRMRTNIYIRIRRLFETCETCGSGRGLDAL